jgi:hypothetical protein
MARSRVATRRVPLITTAEVPLRADLSCRRWMAVVMSRKRRRYSGKLASPIKLQRPPTFWGAVTDERVIEHQETYGRYLKEAQVAVKKQISEKIKLLMKFYEVEKEDMSVLALKLAIAHVPGFKIAPMDKKRGRKNVWDGPKLQSLYDIVHQVKSEHQFSDRHALIFIVNNPEYSKDWGPPKSHGGTKDQWIKTLQNRLQDAKRYISYIDSLPELLENIRADFLKEKTRKC